MATKEEAAGGADVSVEVVGNAFVEQYYRMLHQSPEVVHRFYQNSSMLSRPDSDGFMTTVTTMQAINEKILSLKYEDHKVEIETADAQESYRGGVIVTVTGCLTGGDGARRKFTQMFFLAPQEGGYFVLNDVSRIIDSTSPSVIHVPTVRHDGDDDRRGEEEEEVPSPSVADSSPSKKSYAYMVTRSRNPAVYVPTGNVRAAPLAASDQQSRDVSGDEPPETSGNGGGHDDTDGHSVYVGNLPFNATSDLLDREFSRFGPIKRGGIQVRSGRGFCFGFVCFLSVGAMQSALRASPLFINGHEAVVEMKRGSPGVGGRWSYSPVPSRGRPAYFLPAGFRGGGGRAVYSRNTSDFAARRPPVLRNVGYAYRRLPRK